MCEDTKEGYWLDVDGFGPQASQFCGSFGFPDYPLCG